MKQTIVYCWYQCSSIIIIHYCGHVGYYQLASQTLSCWVPGPTCWWKGVGGPDEICITLLKQNTVLLKQKITLLKQKITLLKHYLKVHPLFLLTVQSALHRFCFIPIGNGGATINFPFLNPITFLQIQSSTYRDQLSSSFCLIHHIHL